MTANVYYSRADLVRDINRKLAGENLSFAELQLYIDSAIDDINAALNSCYPTTTEMEQLWEIASSTGEPDPNTLPICYKDWNGMGTLKGTPYLTILPMSVVRSVIIPGAALKWLKADDEGIEVAPAFEAEYKQAMFILQRDYANKIPEEFQAKDQGFVYDSFHNSGISFEDGITNRRVTNSIPDQPPKDDWVSKLF